LSASEGSRTLAFAISARRSTLTAPFIQSFVSLERAAGFTHDDVPQAKSDKLDVLVAHSLPLRHDIALIVAMLSLPNDGRNPKLELTPEQSRQDNPGSADGATASAVTQSGPNDFRGRALARPD
jgi:hypothetical protein